MSNEVLIEEMTWVEVEEAIRQGRDTALFACGAIEQHGPHLPIGTDTYLGTAIAKRAAQKLGNALVAPTLRPGASEHHMNFPGSMTLRFETFIMLLEDYCTSLARSGFRRIVMFSSHGGNSDLMAAHFPAIAKKLADRTLVYMVVPQRQAAKEQQDFLAEQGVSIGAAGAHAGYTETAEMLVVHPELVKMDEAVPGLADDDVYSPERVRFSQLKAFVEGIDALSPETGVLGDPTGAAAEVGQKLLDFRVKMIVEQLRALDEEE